MEVDEPPVPLFNKYLAYNEVGRYFSDKFERMLRPLLDEAIQHNIDLRDLECVFSQILGCAISERVLTRAMEMRKKEDDERRARKDRGQCAADP